MITVLSETRGAGERMESRVLLSLDSSTIDRRTDLPFEFSSSAFTAATTTKCENWKIRDKRNVPNPWLFDLIDGRMTQDDIDAKMGF